MRGRRGDSQCLQRRDQYALVQPCSQGYTISKRVWEKDRGFRERASESEMRLRMEVLPSSENWLIGSSALSQRLSFSSAGRVVGKQHSCSRR